MTVTVSMCRTVGRLAMAAALLACPAFASAQELEPGAYWPLPVGLNIMTVMGGVNWGDVNFDPTLPVEDANATIGTTAVAFSRAFNLYGRSANASGSLPVLAGNLTGFYQGTYTEVDRFGLGDPRLKLAVNLYGAPAMTPAEFRAYRQRSIVGISVTVAPPLGQYEASRLVNLGTNRWSVKPELGFSHARGKWVFETMAGVWLFTDNDEFAPDRTREQDPILVTQFHLTHRFSPRMWLSGNANFFVGGRTTVEGLPNLDLQRNSRVGVTFSRSLRRGHALRLAVSRGAYTTIGADFSSVAVGYNFAWPR
jgi:Putative MetA-pathway of phenol degradation